MEFINYIIYLGGWRPYLFSYECIWDVLQSSKRVKKEMSCCDDPTAHQPNATAASASAIKALTTSGVSVECPDPIVAAAMLEATQLTDREREIILGVLGRDELLRRDQQLRVLQLKAELQNLRRKGALKPTTNLDTTGLDQDPDRYCRRCRVELGRVINRGSYCRACRLKVCKACREYSLRTTDWVCTVCKKQMEIQAASGEWMNEFVKRPNKRRENRVCLPTADIIKRTIRRSWTISNPTPRWSAMRGSPELRPYNSLPRKQDINNYPSLVLYQANLKNQENSSQENPSPTYRRRSPRRTQSEDIYDDQGSSSQFRGTSPVTPEMERSSRMNPLIKLPDGKPDIERRRSPMRRSNEGSSEDGSSKEDGSPKSKGILTPETARKFDRSNMEKRVSFESHVPYARMSRPTPVLRTQSLIEGRVQNHLPSRYPAHHEDNSDNSEEAAHGDAHDSREENNPIELCEIEPFSGTVFRKMMVRRRRQNNARNISGSTSNCSTTAENGWRRGPDSDLWDILLPEGDDYKLVFMNSDGSSKEETSSREEDDNDSSSTASSFPIDECDWDYFEPGTRPAPVINWSSPFGSPRVYRRGVADSPIGSPLVYRRRMRESDTGTDEDNVRQDSGSPASSDSIFQPRIIPEDSPFDSTTQLRSEKMLEDTSALRCVHSEDVSTKPCCHACGAPTQFIPIPVPVPIPFPVPTLWPPHEPPLMVFGEQRFRVLPRNLWPYLSQAALIWPTLNANGGTTDTTMPATTDRDTSALETHKESDIVPPVVGAEEEITGYLECENRYASSSDSSSDDSDNSGPRVRRMYNVSGTERHSDDALPSSNVSSDNDENDGRLSHSSVREDDMTSSGSDDTDSDDTGTVADQKSKRFSRIFVVNKNLSSSSNSCSSSSDTDTSDNDTDTELDCTVVLTNVKQLEEEKDDVCDSKSSDKDTKKSEIEYYFSSPGLSDVSAESVNSSDVDNNDLITKETNVNSTLSKANAEKNLYKINNDTRKKKVCFDDADAVEKETFTDEVAVIKLNKRDIEAINRENDLPFGNEFKLSQAEHFKINKDEVDDAVNENEEISSCLVKSNLTKANKKSKKTAVTFSLSEGDNNKSEEDNKTLDNIEATIDKNDEEFIVSVISGEEKTSNESLTKEHLDVFAFSGTTEKAVNDDNKGKTNNYTKTVLSACSTIQANILFDEQHNENFNLNISPSLTDTFGNDDVNIQNQNSKDFMTFSTSDNYEQIDKSTINDDDNYKTTFFSDSTTDNLTTTDDLIVKIVKNDKDFDTDNLDSITDEQLNDYFEKFSHSTNKTSNDNDVIDNKNDDETTISASHLTATRINDNEDIDTRNNDKFTESAGLKRNDRLNEDTGDNNKDNDVETKDLDYTIQNLTVESNKDIDTECFDKFNVFSGTTIDEGAVSDDMDTTDNEENDFINAFEMTQVTITSPISNFDLKSTIHDEDVKDNIEGVVENISDDHFEESGKYGVVKDLYSDTLTTTPKLNKVLIKTCDENDKNQDAKEDKEALIDGSATSNKLDDTDHAGLEKRDNVMNLDNVLVSTSVEELRKDGDVERSEIYDENIVTTGLVLGTNGLNEEINKIISKSLENYEKLERNDGTVDLNLLASSSKDATDEEVDKFEISSRKSSDEKLDDGNEINGENDTLFDITYTIITDNEKIETIEENKSSLTIDENKIETMELTNIDETIIEDIDKLDETIAACNLIDTVMNFDSEYSNDIDLPTYDTISYAKTVEELPISQKSNAATLDISETAEILVESQENDNVDDYIVTEYDTFSLAVEIPQEISFTESAENINVTDNEYYIFSSPHGVSKATQQFNKLQEYETDRFSTEAQKLDTDNDKTSKYETLSVGVTKATQRHTSQEKISIARADDSGAIEYGNDMLSSAYDATKNAEKIVKPEEKKSASNVDDDIVIHYEFEMLAHGTSKFAKKFNKSVTKISTIEADDEIEILAHGIPGHAEKLTEPEEKIATSKVDDGNVTDYEFLTLSSVNDAMKNTQKFTKPQEETGTDNAGKDIVTEHEFNIVSLSTPKITLEKPEQKTTIKSTDDNKAIEYALSSSHGTRKGDQSTENIDDQTATKYEFAKHYSAQDDLQTAPKLTKLQDVISTDDALSLGAPKTNPRLGKSQEKIYIGSTDDNSVSDYEFHAPSASKGSRTLTEAPEEISTENTDDENVTKYKFAILSTAQDDLKNAQKLTKPPEESSTDNAEKYIVTEHEFSIVSLGTPETTLEKSEEITTIKSTDDNNIIEYALYSAHGTQKRNQSTENVGDETPTKYEFAKHSSSQDDLQTAPKLTKLQDVISIDDALSLGAPETTPRLSKSQEKIYIWSTDDNSASDYEFHASSASKGSQTLTEAPEKISTENTDDEKVTKYKFVILSSDQDDLKNAQKFTEPQEEISTDNAEKYIVTEQEFNIISLDTPKTTQEKSEEKPTIESTNDNNAIEYALSSGHGTQKRNQSTENVVDENVTKYEFAKHSSSQDDLQTAPKLTKLQDVISTDDALFLGPPKTTPRLSKSQEKIYIGSTDDNSASEYEYHASSALKASQTSTEAPEEISTENTDDENVTKYKFAILSSAQDDLKNAQKFNDPQEETSTDNAEKDIVTEHEFNIVSLGTPKTTLEKSEEEPTIKSTDDNNVIEYALFSSHGTQKRNQSTENNDDENVTKYEFPKHSSAQDGLQTAPKLTKLQDVISTDDALSLGAPKTTKRLSKSQEKIYIGSTDDNSASEYEYHASSALKASQTSTEAPEEISTENTDDENVTKYKFAILSSAQDDLKNAQKFNDPQEETSTDNAEKDIVTEHEFNIVSLGTPKTTPEKSEEEPTIKSTDDNNVIEYALFSGHGTQKRNQSTENVDDENVTKYEFAKHSSSQDDLQTAPKLTKLQDVISTDDALFLGPPKTTPRLSKSQEKIYIGSTDDNSASEYEYHASSALKASQTSTEAPEEISTENTDDENVTKYKFAILSSAQDDLKNAQKFNDPQEETSTDNAEKDIVTEHEFNIVSLGTPKTTLEKSEEEPIIKSTDDNNVIEYALFSSHGTQKRNQSTENVDDENVTKYEFAKHSSAQDGLQTAPKLSKLQDVISTDDALSLGAPKTTPILNKSQEKIYIGSTDDNSSSEYEYHASSALKASQTSTEAPEEIGTENTGDENVTKYKFAILSSDEDDLKNAQKFNDPQEETSTDNAEKDIVTEHEFNIVSLGTPKTTLEETTIKSTDDNNVIEYALFSGHSTQKRNQSTENVDNENVTKYEFAKHSSAQDDLQKAPKLIKLQDVISTDDALSLGAPKTTPRLSASQEKTNIESTDDNIAIEYDASKKPLPLTKSLGKMCTENSDDENVTKYEFFTLSSAQDDLCNAQKWIKLQEVMGIDNDNVTEEEFNTLSLDTPKTTPRISKSLEKTSIKSSDAIEYEYDTLSSAYGILKIDQKLTKSQEKINTVEAIEFVTLPLAESASKTAKILDKSQDKANTEIVDYVTDTCISKPAQVLGKLQEKISTEHTDDKNAIESDNDNQKMIFEKSADDNVVKCEKTLGIPEFELKSFDTEEIDIFEENDKYRKTAADENILKFDYTLSSDMEIPEKTQGKPQDKISSERKSAEEINEEFTDDEKSKYVIHSAAPDYQKYQSENINREFDKFNVTPKKFELYMQDEPGDSFEKFTLAPSPGVKFELKPFDTEEINIFEETDESGKSKNVADDYALEYDYTFSSDLGIPKNTQEKINSSRTETIPSGRKIFTTGKSADEINNEAADDEKIKYVIHSAALDFQKHQEESDKLNATPREFELYMLDEPRDSLEKFTRAPSPGVKFELKPFDAEEINIFEETDESERTKNDTNDYALEYDYTFSSALGIPNKIQEQFAKRQETVSSRRKMFTSGKADEEINKDFADDEKLTRAAFQLYMLDEPRDSVEKFTRTPSSGVKYELKPFNTEEINIFEENDRSKKTKYAADNYAFEYDSTCSSTLGVTKKTLGKITKSQETISSGREIFTAGKSAQEINNEADDDEKIKYVIHSAALDFQKHQGENINKESDKLNATPREFELYKLDEPRDSFEKFTRAPSLGVKYELKPFDTEEINIFEETDESKKTKNDADDYSLEYDYIFSSALGIPKNTQKKITKSQIISSERKLSTSGKSADEINNEVADDEKFTRAASSGIKFELKPFITEEINIFEENDKSGKNKNSADDYALENDYTFSSALGIPKKSQETISCERKIFTKSCKSPDEEPSGVKFELKPFDIETISIFEETDKSGKPVALKDLDIVKNKQDLNYSEYSNRTVVYSSFDNNPLDISRRHEIIQSFDKTGRITDCTVDIKSDDDDDEDTFENTDKINLAQTFKFTLRSYGEEEKKIEDCKKMNVLEKIFKKKVKSEKDSPPKQQEIDRLINKMVEAISSEYPTDNDQLMDVVLGGETPVESAGADDQRALSEWNEIRSIDAVNVEGKSLHGRNDGVQPGAIVCGEVLSRHAARYTSLVMITQDPAPNYQQVSVVTSDTTTLVPGNDVVVRHTNWQEDDNKQLGKKRDNQNQERGSVTVITGGDTLSAFEEGLADDDSWVENLSHDEEDEDEFATNSGTEDSSSGEEVTLTCSAAIDQEEDLRGYHRAAIDFTLHTIVEESCEESEVEQNVPKKKERPASATDLEKYFFFGLGDGMGPSLQSNREDAFSETSSIYSEGMESLGSEEVQTSNDNSDPAELASSRLEKYFLSGFMGFTAERRDSDGSVGSDSEGRPSPEQRRKRLVRARGTGRSHSSSLDNLDNAISEQTIETQMSSEHSSSSDSENYDDTNSFEKPDGQFDTVKRKKNKKHKNASSADESKNLETTQEMEEKCSDSDEDGNKTPQPEVQSTVSNLTTTKNQQSRDSGFVGSCDDLLREQRDNSTPDFTSVKNELIKTELEDITEEKKTEEKSISVSTPPATSLTRKDSFNNWSSDEETNLMMCKMRQFFKTMVANSQLSASSKPSTPNLSCTIKPLPSPRAKRCKPPQLVYFENELTRLMKTVPGIREDQVREIVEYLSSEDTWSDSYDSSDYTSSDLEITTSKTVLQQQISDSCKQIINKFDNGVDDEGDEGDGGIIDESHGLNKETAFVYQKLVASFEKMAAGENSDSNISKVAPHSSPPLIAKVMHHIGSRLVALMHEVSSGESHASNSPKTKHYHRRLQHKISSASSTTTEDDCPEGAGDILGYEDHVPYNLLPRSRSHDLLVGEARILHQSISGVSDITEEKEASDCERFSWRGSFESALLATDSRNRLSLLGGEASASASALAIAAKRRSAGDLLFSNKSLSREQLDRVRSCGSIGGANSEDKLWVASAIRPNRRRSSVPDATCGSGGSADGEDEDEDIESRSTLPRSLQGGTPTTNSLPRLPTTVSSSSIQKSQSHHVLSQNVKSARYRPPGFNRLTSMPKRAVSAPGLQPSHQRRGRRSQQNNVPNEIIKSDDMLTLESTNGPPETGKQEKKYLPNIDEFHVILETMSTVCAVQPSTALTINPEDEGLIPKVCQSSEDIDGQNEQRHTVEVNPVQEKKSSKPTITISSTISKSVPEISKSTEDGNNKLPLPHKDEAGVSEAHSSPMLASPRNGTKSATTSPVTPSSKRVGRDWHHEEDLDRIVGLHGRASLSTLGARSDSMASVYSGAGEGRYGSVAVRGQVEFGLQYNYKAGALEIQIKQCKDLAPVDTKRNRSDPYVKVYLLPDKSKSGKRKTKVKKHTLNPVFDECLKFHISLNGLESRTLWLTVWHSDMFGRNDFLGEVMMTLENKVFDDPTPKWYNLQERTEPFEDVPSYRGDVIVCLKFVPPDMTIQKKGKRSRGALHVLIKEAKALTAVKANGTSDPFCKSYLLPDKGRSSKQKTPIARRTTNPVWNYTFVYDDVSLQELAERCLELTVWDHDRLASNEFLGGVRFSLGTGKHYGKPVDWMDASGREMSLWKNMLEKPNFWVEGSLSLRSSLESRGS